MAVEHGWNPVTPTDPTRGAFAELGTRFGADADLGHDGTLLNFDARNAVCWITRTAVGQSNRHHGGARNEVA
jgi:hypothetical protein